MSPTRLTACVLLPFSAGYFLSYLFRTINAVIATDLAEDLNLGAVELGFLTAIYFLVLAGAQLPFGAVLDRHGPKMIQSALLLLASTGALTFALADCLVGLVIGRALLALGVALGLMAGFKAIVVWFPAGRVVVANGWLVMLGALGAVTATTPAELVLQTIGWRGLFAALAGLSALVALLLLFAVPDNAPSNPPIQTTRRESLWTAYRDRRFWRVAPLSALGVGTSWSLQGLWAAPWLRDVDGLDRADIVHHLSAMAIAVCAGALLFGAVGDRLRRLGVKMELLLATTISVSIAAQAGLVLGCPLPSYLLWSVIAGAGAATVLSFAILPSYFPKEMSGRANAALNLLHVSAAFVLQSGTGFVIAQWPMTNGGYALEAHQAAMAVGICAQLVALGWFIQTRHRPAASRAHDLSFSATRPKVQAARGNPLWGHRMQLDHRDAGSWRLAASACATLCVTLAALLWQTANVPISTIRITSVAFADSLPNEWFQGVKHVSRWQRALGGTQTWLGDAIHDRH